jgi:hypothetical protein
LKGGEEREKKGKEERKEEKRRGEGNACLYHYSVCRSYI